MEWIKSRTVLLCHVFALAVLAFSAYQPIRAQEHSVETVAGGRDNLELESPAENGIAGGVSDMAIGADGAVYFIDRAYRVRRLESDGIVRTVAGNGRHGYSGDNGPALEASIEATRLAVDPAGNLYIAGGARIRKIGLNGQITTIAGTGESGFSGDGGPGSAAQIGSLVLSLVADGSGNVYIADLVNNRVRRIGPDGTIQTVAGNGNRRLHEDWTLFPNGIVPEVFSVAATGEMATLSRVSSLALDGDGGLWIATSNDGVSARIWKVDIANGRLRWIAGELSKPVGDNPGGPPRFRLQRVSSLAVRDQRVTFLGRVEGIDEDPLFLRQFRLFLLLSSGPHARINNYSAELPYYGSADTREEAYRRADQLAAVSRYISPSEGYMRVAPDGTQYFVVLGAIKRVSPGSDTLADVVGLDRGVHEIGWPRGVAADDDGNTYVADSYNRQVLRLDSDGNVTVLAGNGSDRSDLSRGWTAAADFPNGGPATAAPLGGPIDVAVGPSGSVYFLDAELPQSNTARNNNYFVRKVDVSGAITTVYGGRHGSYPNEDGAVGFYLGVESILSEDALVGARSIAVNSNEEVFVLAENHLGERGDTEGRQILKIAADGQPVSVTGFGRGPRVHFRASYPSGSEAQDTEFWGRGIGDIAFGTNDALCFTYSGAVMAIFSDGTLFPVATPGLGFLRYLAVRPDEYLYFSLGAQIFRALEKDLSNRDRIFDPPDLIAGNGKFVFYSGDGSPATDFSIIPTGGMDIGADGKVLFSSGFRVRSLTPLADDPFEVSAILNAASLSNRIAVGSIATITGTSLASGQAAQGPLGTALLALPTDLLGTSVEVTDSAGRSHAAGLHLVSPSEIMFRVPAGMSQGMATVTVRRGEMVAQPRTVTFLATAPGLFSANRNGRGVAAGTAVRRRPDGSTQQLLLALFNDATESYRALPLDLDADGGEVFVTLFGTGLGEGSVVAAQVGGTTVGATPASAFALFPGAEQVTIGPLSSQTLSPGEHEVVVTVDGEMSNAVTIAVR